MTPRQRRLKRQMWGVVLVSPYSKEDPVTLFHGWLKEPPASRYSGEPTWPLCWITRNAARQWACERNAFYRSYPHGHPCRRWRCKIVRFTCVYVWNLAKQAPMKGRTK